MPEVRVSERVTPFVGAQIDEEAGVIRRACICGFASLNGGDYTPRSFGDCKQYEGKKSFTNHSKNGRLVEELLGWWQDCQPRGDGKPEGDFHFLKSHPMAGRLIEIAKRNPAAIGFSHVAMCETTPGKAGRFTVEQVKAVESIDLVADPATTKGLFESHQQGRTVPTIAIREAVKRFGPKLGPARWGRWAKLAEDAALGDLPMEDVPDAGGDQDAETALQTLIAAVAKQAIAGELSPDEAAAKVKAFLETHLKTPASGGEEKAAESVQKPATRLTYEAVAAEMDQLTAAKLPTNRHLAESLVLAGDRKGLFDALRQLAAPPRETPTSAGRGEGKPVTEGKKPDDRKLVWN